MIIIRFMRSRHTGACTCGATVRPDERIGYSRDLPGRVRCRQCAERLIREMEMKEYDGGRLYATGRES